MIVTLDNPADISKAISPPEKEQNLRFLMRELGSVLVAYSGGVDSSYLALIATQELGASAKCVIGLSPSVSQHQRDAALETSARHGFNLETIETGELDDERYASNPQNRCYFCKSELYSKLADYHSQNVTIIDGTNADDLLDHRPGRVAAGENNVRSPLAELSITKNDIRELSRIHDLETWDRPASPCLSSRIAHGVPVTIGRLSKIERGEELLRRLGFVEFRVRVHDEIARIEIAREEFRNAFELVMIDTIADEFRKIGFKYVTLDLHGFRSGSMNVMSNTVVNQVILEN